MSQLHDQLRRHSEKHAEVLALIDLAGEDGLRAMPTDILRAAIVGHAEEVYEAMRATYILLANKASRTDTHDLVRSLQESVIGGTVSGFGGAAEGNGKDEKLTITLTRGDWANIMTLVTTGIKSLDRTCLE